MKIINSQLPSFVYTYAYPDEERSLCHLEMRSFFGEQAPADIHTPSHVMRSTISVGPDRSPFMRERIEVLYEGDQFTDILQQVGQIDMEELTFKVIYVKTNDLDPSQKIEFDEQRQLEWQLGMQINGAADVRTPDHIFGVITLGGRWYFGHYIKSKAVWFQQMKKPRSYSIALSTRVARAVANIAAPEPAGVTLIDPCCGIGTVLIEALSMGMNITGRDLNHFIVHGARENIAHFGFDAEVTVGDIADVTEMYDVAIIDLPYNHFSSTSPEEQLLILQHGRRIASKVIIVTAELIDPMIATAGLTIIDRCDVRKGSFVRQIIVSK